MKTFFHAFNFKLRERTLIRAKEEFAYLEADEIGGELESEGGCDCNSKAMSLSWGFQKQASFLLLLTVASTSYLLHIPHTVTFCWS